MFFFTATYYSYERYYYLKNSGSPDSEYGVAPLFAGEFSYYLGLKKTWLAFGKFSGYFLLHNFFWNNSSLYELDIHLLKSK